MKIIVAGAGAGKTTTIAEDVLKRYKDISDGKIIYVITYTNAARNHIRNKIIEKHGSIPYRIKIETSHVFLLQEIIFPFHHLLYKQSFSNISVIKLSQNHSYKAKKINELKEQGIIHVEEVTKIARYIIKGKSSDRKLERKRRLKILSIIKKYLESIFIDEAQDMDGNLSDIIQVFYQNQIYLHIVGDPKQDLRGSNEFKQLITNYSDLVEYKKENYRCPEIQVNLSNKYIPEIERQYYQTKEIGSIKYLFEKDIKESNFFEVQKFDYLYIYQKNERYFTNNIDREEHERLLNYELNCLVQKSISEEEQVKKRTFFLFKLVQSRLFIKDNWKIINEISNLLYLKLSSKDKARLCAALDLNRKRQNAEGIKVNSIDKVKGLEGNRCLFILTSELAAYLFQEKIEENKMTNYLYVALTRAKKELFILITEEVENSYGREWINEKFSELLE